jgi:hypothetical protein
VRIPNINQTGVPGAEQISLGAISSAAQGKMRTTSTLTKVVNDYQAKVVKAETDEEYSRLSNGFTRDTGAAWEEIKSQAQVDGNGAPTHDQLMPQYQAAHDKIFKDYSGRVKFNPNQAAFTQFADRTLTGNTNTVRGETGRRTIEHLSGAYQQSKIDLMNGANGLEDFAKVQESAVATGLVSSGQAAVDYDSFQHEFKTNQIMSEFKSEREMGRGQEYLDSISGKTNPIEGSPQERNPNITFPESFDEGEQQLMIDRMNADLREDQVIADREVARVKREAAAIDLTITKKANKALVMLKSGQTIAPSTLENINETISLISDPDKQAEMLLNVEVYSSVQSLMSMTMEERSIAMQATEENITSPDQAVLNSAVRSSVSTMDSLISKDPHHAWAVFGGGRSTDAITKENLPEVLSEIQAHQIEVSAWLGVEAPPMSLSQISQIKRLGPTIVDEIQASYGKEDSEQIFNMLYQDGAHEMAVVGALALQVDGVGPYTAYLKGHHTIANDPDYEVGSKRNLSGDNKESLFHEATVGLFPGNVGFTRGLKDVSNVIYAGLAKDANIMAGELDSDLYTQAIEMATGKVVEYNGTRLLMPGRNWDETRFTDAIDDLKMPDIVSMGGFQNVEFDDGSGRMRKVSPEQMLIKLQGGGADITQGEEFGLYYVSFGQREVLNAEGGEFILDLRGK